MTPYQRGHQDAKAGRAPQWRYTGNASYMKGHLDGSLALYRRPKPWWCIF